MELTHNLQIKQIVEESLSISKARDYCISVWLFGSFGKIDRPSDIDILYIYKYDTELSWKSAIMFRKILDKLAVEVFNLHAHIVILTYEEERQIRFISNESCVKIYLRVI
jgi:predicted nucleotidyltransferase